MPTETMTSRQRVIRTLNRQPVDRMPIDLGCHFSTGISAFAYHHLREHLGLSTESIEIPDMVQCLARVDEDILRRFHCDCILLQPRWSGTRTWRPREPYAFAISAHADPRLQENGDWVLEKAEPGGRGRRRSMRMPAGGFFFDGDWISDWHGCPEEQLLDRTAREAERISNETDYATMYRGGFDAFFGDMDFLCRMLEEPEEVARINNQRCEAMIARAARAIEALGPHVQLVELCEDLGMQSGPLCRPSVFFELCAPYIRRFCRFIHDHSDWKIFLHSCGSIRPLIPILIDCGIDVLNPVQISAQDMDPQQLKAEYGERIIFWGGGCNTQHVLGARGPAAVAANVRELVGIFKPGGGFVFNQVHNVMGDVPPENIVAMLDTAYEQSWY